jgi:hypothetical protein
MTKIGEAIILCNPFTDKLQALGFEYRIQLRNGEQYLDIKSDGFKQLKVIEDG